MTTDTNADDIDIENSIETLHAALREIAAALEIDEDGLPTDDKAAAKFAACLADDPKALKQAEEEAGSAETLEEKFVEVFDLVDAIHAETTGKTESIRETGETKAFKAALGGGR